MMQTETRYDILLNAGEWDFVVHAAGCRDVGREARRSPFANVMLNVPGADALDAALDDDDREMGFTEDHVRVMPCAE